MVTEDYVSLETAKLLNTKGFKGEFHKHYWCYEPGKEFLTDGSFNPEYDYPAPTLQMTMKWLREEKDIIIEMHHLYRKEWYAIISSENPLGISVKSTDSYSSYEEACEAGIKYCLENLI